ncbi:hypothetical protein KOR34_26050 [Posidoniimonas corsicana]|uniref:Prophage CP4-57 regulatory protein (AlpA) n=1 Tax=Posidoniimonas corsicana TaxID=1938618 RepID=A0A5C5VI29_9BACT|nr:hypothetical protein [Posidoniimonas corsicana]TWT37647.1 hypothetical protein KOR34_26050 [Posidoniimonas corsicana]
MSEPPIRTNPQTPAFPVVHIDELCERLNVSRDWAVRVLLKLENPPPHFTIGQQTFFGVEPFNQWMLQMTRAAGFDVGGQD